MPIVLAADGWKVVAVGFGPKMHLALLNRMPTGMRDRVLRAVVKQPR